MSVEIVDEVVHDPSMKTFVAIWAFELAVDFCKPSVQRADEASSS